MIKSRKVQNKKRYQEHKMNQKKKWITQRKLICFLLRKRTILHFSQLSNNKRIIIYGNGNFWFIQFLIWKDLYIQYKESIQQRKSNKKQLK